ncbi:selenocysteine-specific elongation factor-like protein [Perkinsela sp. CCAP 1560/4]|nr:selenocysteine-specific elongation factor-like protein [Perkinsela sp. CCAP 1560/4]|eukprot:KNH08367.1 selenocysteine-specific elongation factor-like protein [Perkinsela sp. CCAP 1560/4]
MNSTFNLNVGLFGHVDSGKTSIAKSLSSLPSTACFDKHRESRERGITIDLGFSAYQTEASKLLQNSGCSSVQYTIVDCPGHADFIRTIIGGANIIDVMLLVVDINKGIQTQTSECIVIGEIINKPMVLLLNKVDMLEDEEQCEENLKNAIGRVSKQIRSTRWKYPTIIPMSTMTSSKYHTGGFQQLDVCLQQIAENISQERFPLAQKKTDNAEFVAYIDHSFQLKGKGSILTGTILEGSLELNQLVEIPTLNLQRRVKSMQSFHAEVSHVSIGDRVGICLKEFPAEKIERTLICSVGCSKVQWSSRIVVQVHRVRFYSRSIRSGETFHISFGHENSLAYVKFIFGSEPKFSIDSEYTYLEELPEEANALYGEGTKTPEQERSGLFFALINFPRPILFYRDALLIASRLDHSLSFKSCRVAFHGDVCYCFGASELKQNVKVSKKKRKELLIDRWVDSQECICKSLFRNNPMEVSNFIGQRVFCESTKGDESNAVNIIGKISSTFGRSGKLKVLFQSPVRQIYEANQKNLTFFVELEKSKYV